MWFLAPDAIIKIFATVWAIACVRGDPETFSRELRIVTRSVQDFKKNVIYSEQRQKQIKFRFIIQLKLDVSFRFPLLLLFCRLSTVFVIAFEIYETTARKLSRFCFKFSKAKIHSPLVSQYKLSRWISARQLGKRARCNLQAPKKAEILTTNSDISVGFRIGRIFFRKEKKPRSRFWLARTHARTKIYDGTFTWVYLSMYIINFWKDIFDRQQLDCSQSSIFP